MNIALLFFYSNFYSLQSPSANRDTGLGLADTFCEQESVNPSFEQVEFVVIGETFTWESFPYRCGSRE